MPTPAGFEHTQNTTKNRARRISLDYHRQREPVRMWKRGLGFAALLLIPAGWVAYGSEEQSAPGPVRHYLVAGAEFEQDGCRKCHEPWALEPPTQKMCAASCHEEIVSKGVHPFGNWGDGALASVPPEMRTCGGCHNEHRGAAISPTADQMSERCARCHTTGVPEGFEKHQHAEPVTRTLRLAFNTFSHASHLKAKLACADCHERRGPGDPPEAEGSVYRGELSQFAPVRFEKCMSCHEPGTNGAPKYAAAWHGAGEARNCLQCHASLHAPELKRADGRHVAQLRRFDVRSRSHVHETVVANADCSECHKNTEQLARARLLRGRVFPHERHVADLDAKAGCIDCHAGVNESRSLAGAHGEYEPAHCATCHRDEDSPERSLVAEPAQVEVGRTGPDFPHARHTSLACRECHTFEKGAGDARELLIAKTTAAARSCLPCHQGHDQIAGGACRTCHKDGVDVYWGERAESQLATWERPVDPTFDHGSIGHRDTACAECHDGAGTPARVSEATTLAEVPIPTESWPVCVDCHVKQRRRFHFK